MENAMRSSNLCRAFILIAILLLASCVTLDRFVDAPRVSITQIEVLPMQGLQPRFAVHLQVLNPNPVSIPITGMAYDISLNGYQVFSGATSEVPSLPAYEEVPMRVEVGANIMQSIGFISGLVDGRFSTVDYSINSEIKVSGITRPYTVTESGQVDLVN